MDRRSHHQPRQEELAIPLWDVGPALPPAKERRRDRGAAHRHMQAQNGVAPADAVQRRRPPQRQQAERVVKLWLDFEDGLQEQEEESWCATPIKTGADVTAPGAESTPVHTAACQDTTAAKEQAPSCGGDRLDVDAVDVQPHPQRPVDARRGLLAAAAAWVGVVAEAR